MDDRNLLLIFAGLFNLIWVVLFLRSYFRGINRKIANFFIFNVVTVFLWIVAMFFYRFSQENETILILCRFLYVTAILIPITLLYFSYFFPKGIRAHSWFKIFSISLPALFLLYLTLFTSTIINDAYKINGEEHFIVWGQLYFLYVLYIPLYFLWSFGILIKRYRENSGLVRSQALYILIGVSISSFIGMITNLILPSFDYFKLNWIGQVATVIWASFTIYGVARYRLADIRIIFRKIIIYSFSAGFAYGIFFFLAWFFNNYFGGIFKPSTYLLGLFIAPIFVIIFLWFFNFIQRIANRYFFFSLYNYQETINNLSQKLNYLNDLDEIITLIVDTVKKSLQLDKAGVLLVEESDGLIRYRITKVIGFNEKNGISLVQDNFLTRHLQKTQKPLVKEELVLLARDSKSQQERDGFLELESNMRRIEASLCLPLMSSKKLIGIVVLGSKISQDAYAKEDLELLNILAYQAGIAVDNARLYKQIQDLNKNLQAKVDEQTKEIRNAYEIEKKARQELERLDKAKNQFILA
ncbi:MAG: histidine kinase N-terminal 7TM domain-containing protein, partial [Candidatus Pacebacteria bacterium]|nr:histidine kinase N-terminal 7TM domain-containing protein [Candidatus Paceibacterota bacterium]